MQNISLVGRLTKVVEKRTFNTATGTNVVASGTIAVKRRRYNKEKGERESTFINFQVWGKRAETIVNFTAKGSLIELAGEFINNNYTDNNNIKRFELVFEVSDFELLETKNDTEKRMKETQQQQQPNFDNHNQTEYEKQQQNNTGYNYADPRQESIDGMNEYGANTYQ